MGWGKHGLLVIVEVGMRMLNGCGNLIEKSFYTMTPAVWVIDKNILYFIQ